MDPKPPSTINAPVASYFYIRSVIIIENWNASIISPSSAVPAFVSGSSQHDHIFRPSRMIFTPPLRTSTQSGPSTRILCEFPSNRLPLSALLRLTGYSISGGIK